MAGLGQTGEDLQYVRHGVRSASMFQRCRLCAPLLALAALGASVPSRATAAPVGSAPPPGRPLSSSAPTPGSGSVAPVTGAGEGPSDERFGDYDRVRTDFSVLALASAGLMPNVGFGAGASAGFRWRWANVAIEGRLLGIPDFSLGEGQSAHGLAGIAVLKSCVHSHRPDRPLGIYSLGGCFLAGAGRLGVQPNGPARSEEAHPFIMLLGLRWLATWQLSSGLYLSSFLEFDANPFSVNLSLNGNTVWGGDSLPAHFGGFLGFEFDIVGFQPARWDKPARNPDEPAP